VFTGVLNRRQLAEYDNNSVGVEAVFYGVVDEFCQDLLQFTFINYRVQVLVNS